MIVLLDSVKIDIETCKSILREVRDYLEGQSPVVIDELYPNLPGGHAYGNYTVNRCPVRVSARDCCFHKDRIPPYRAELSLIVGDGLHLKTQQNLNNDLEQILAKYGVGTTHLV